MEAHFPAGTWFSAWDEAGAEPPVVAGPAGRLERLAAPLGDVPVHFRGGVVLALQQGGLTTAAVRASGVTLVVALPEQARVGPHAVWLGYVWRAWRAPLPCCVPAASRWLPHGPSRRAWGHSLCRQSTCVWA